MSISNEQELNAIRQRADEYAKAADEFKQTRAMSPRYLELINEIDNMRVTAPDDIATLLAHVDELTRKLAAAEAALKPFANTAIRFHEHEQEYAERFAAYPAVLPLKFETWFKSEIDVPLLLHECEIAASALAGNGGA